jgi:hypothetical protein
MAPILAPPIAVSALIACIGRSTPDKLVTVTVIASSVLVPLWGMALAWWAAGSNSGFPGFWGSLGVIWGLSYVSRRLSLAWTKPRPLRRALTGLHLIGRNKTLQELWKRKRNLQTELETLFPNRPS